MATPMARNDGDDVYVDSTGKRFKILYYWSADGGTAMLPPLSLTGQRRLILMEPESVPEPEPTREYVPLDRLVDEHATHGQASCRAEWQGEHAREEYEDLLEHLKKDVVRFRDSDRVKGPSTAPTTTDGLSA